MYEVYEIRTVQSDIHTPKSLTPTAKSNRKALKPIHPLETKTSIKHMLKVELAHTRTDVRRGRAFGLGGLNLAATVVGGTEGARSAGEGGGCVSCCEGVDEVGE